jgi:5-methyltetrahydrofolate--homocysteine methyltransferase
MADYHLEDLIYELNFESAKIAREVADEFTAKKSRQTTFSFVAGSIGPNKQNGKYVTSDVNDPGYRAVTFDDLCIAYKQQVEALIDGGSGISWVETILILLNAKALLLPSKSVKDERNIDIPIMWCRGTITDAFRKNTFWANSGGVLVSSFAIPSLSVGILIFRALIDFIKTVFCKHCHKHVVQSYRRILFCGSLQRF